MQRIPVSRLSNEALIQELKESVAQEGPHTARQIALIVEARRRRLYAAAGYPSMYTYCVGELHLSEDAVWKRFQVARAAQTCPAVLEALAEGRVHLSGLTMLATHLTPENVDELLAAATHKSKREIEKVLAGYFPKADLQAQVRAIPQAAASVASPEEGSLQLQTVVNTESEPAPGQVCDPVILGQACPQAEAPPANERRAHVSDSGHRCEARSDLEYDHQLEYARGGDATVSNIRLRCRAHNQYTAERTYGAEFMRHKRRAGSEASAAAQVT